MGAVFTDQKLGVGTYVEKSSKPINRTPPDHKLLKVGDGRILVATRYKLCI